MEATVERTLVKSPPELWELIDDPDLIARIADSVLPRIEPPPASRWALSLFRREDPRERSIAVERRDPENRLAWRIAEGRISARIVLSLAEKGWGTNVAIAVQSKGSGVEEIVPVLEDLLDELGSPQRRPFVRA